MGDWKYVNGGWEYDSGAPDADPTVTSMLPVYAAGDATSGLTYSRFVPTSVERDAFNVTEAHVRAHLSAVADTDDDPDTRAEDVQVEYRAQDGGTLIVGFLPNAEPTAPYLQPGHDGFADVDATLLREVLGG